MSTGVSLRELLSEDVRRDPYPYYARLHEQGTAFALGRGSRFAVAVCGYDAACQVLRDPDFGVLDARYLDRGSPGWREHPVMSILQASVFNTSGEDHVRVRRLFGRAMTAAQVGELEPMITRIADGLIDRLARSARDGDPVDFMAGFALPFPSDVIGELLGVPAPHRPRLLPLVRVFDSVLELGQHSLAEIRAADDAGTRLYEYFSALVTGRRAQPRDDLISALARLAGQDGEELTEEELLANLVVVFNAGFRTTANLLGNGLALLAGHPDALAALRADPALAPSYVEEILRFDPPVHFAVRCALADAEIAGVPVERGRLVLVLTGAANRDPRRFDDPDTFDPSRVDNHHLAFSIGPHYCLGAVLGRAEGRIAFPRLLDRFADLALAGPPPERRALMLRGYDRLPVRLLQLTSAGR
ncbi:cytochrome P450 [Jatrophihabitans sp.]|uniref:cytochrome P450 n=1 Tax=Jatrophihabitans sp. TaxID=1932789 RepID=UPI002C22D478|nr:cytochrome P450 [Jatrophihabitans sp.]